MFDKMASYFQSLSVKNRYITLFSMGGLSALTLPPIGLFPLWFITIPAFIWILQTATTKKQAFFTGWAWGAGFFIISLYWVSFAMMVDLGSWWWVIPFSAILGPGLLGLYTGFAALLVFLSGTTKTRFILSFITCLSLSEYLRGVLFTGFPWNLFGYSWMGVDAVAQNLSWAGIYGLTFLTIAWASIPAVKNRLFSWVLILSFILTSGWGSYHLSEARHETTDTIIRIVQPNIPQQEKWDKHKKWAHFKTLTNLSMYDPFKDKAPDVIIWPETALTFDIARKAEAKGILTSIIPEAGFLLTGDLRIIPDNLGQTSYFNALTAIDHNGDFIQSWHKSHLVPYGEYIPFRDIINISPIGGLISGTGDFTAGTGPYTAQMNNIPKFSPLICYEIIFPNQVTATEDRPDWIINITNDAWYGRTAGPYQHFAITRARAIETGLPVIRVANTGISGAINPYGQVINRIGLGQKGAVNVKLPAPLPSTFYNNRGNTAFFLMLLLSIMIALNPRKA